MMRKDRINITLDELNKLKVIGMGSDAMVYRANFNLLYKIYYQILPSIDESKIIRDEDGVIISKPVFLNKNYLTEAGPNYEIDGVRLRSKDALNRAIMKRDSISYSSLPILPIYLDNKYAGCAIKYFYPSFGIRNISILPRKMQIKILKEIQLHVEELISNFIYPIDLSNKPDGELGHSNILVDLFFHPHLIDLDGKSTVYCECENQELLQKCLNQLVILYLDILYDLDFSDCLESGESVLDLEYKKYELECKFMPSEYIDKFLNFNMNICEVHKFINDPKILKR